MSSLAAPDVIVLTASCLVGDVRWKFWLGACFTNMDFLESNMDK